MNLRLNANSEEALQEIIDDIKEFFTTSTNFSTKISTEDKVFLDANKNKVNKKVDTLRITDSNNGKETIIKFIPFIDPKQLKIELGGDNLTTIKGKIKNQLKSRGTIHLYSKDKKTKLDEIKRMQKLAGLLNENEDDSDIITIYDILQELQTWVNVSNKELMLAKKSQITNKNNEEFNELINDWQNGKYDEDIDYLYNEIINLL